MLFRSRIDIWHNSFGDIAYQIEWLNGSHWEEQIHESIVEGWRQNYLINFEPDKYILDSDARL